LPPLPVTARAPAAAEAPAALSRRAVWRALREPILLIGLVMILAFFALAAFGNQLTDASPYKTHGVMMIDGVIGAPPYAPSPTFPWGTDHIGRDLQALVLAGARQTLALAFFGMAARMLLGALLGALAGWRQGGRLDRLVSGAANVWAAFPLTIFAALLIQAIGIQQGMWVFIVALCVVGWGEIAQVVRRQVIGIKPQLFVESAEAAGARPGEILTRHVIPNVLPALLVLAVLEMGGVLMLLSELGFLNIFLGGGFKAELGVGQITYYSDVPEWGALLANIRAWWRSYPWFAWYPGVAFFLTIMGFNLFGEGLRRFIERSRVNVSRLFNRYTALALVAVVVALVFVLRGVAPLGLYKSEVRLLNTERIMEDIHTLAGPALAGREMGLPGAHDAAQVIARRMADIGLIPIGDKGTFIQTMGCAPYHMDGMPELNILDDQGKPAEKLVYRRDFVEHYGLANTAGAGKGQVVGLVTGAVPDIAGADPFRLQSLELRDKIIIVPEKYDRRLSRGASAGTLVVASDAAKLQRRYLFTPDQFARPYIVQYISPQTADRLLATAGSSLADLEKRAAKLGVGETAITEPGVAVQMKTSAKAYGEPDSACYNVLGIIPGTGAEMGARQGQGMDSQIIMITAYYDGLGVGPEGTLYPGANDNASGVAMMLELARALKETPYAPKKTIMFVAWAGGERWIGLSTKNIMNAQPGFSAMTIEAVIELAGVGAGEGKAIALAPGSSYRLVQLFEQAAGRLGNGVTARGRGPHGDQVILAGFGGRSAMSAYVSWDGSFATAHLASDTPEAIDQEKLRRLGQTTLLSVLVMSREPNY
jgi:ABC-type dipeptide/oligopeptide/nickel transport system permease subunit